MSDVLTTGEIAKHCGVNFRTVIRWIERGYLPAYRLPGRGDNRVKIDHFISFLQQYGMPVPEELQPMQRRVLIVEDDRNVRYLIQRILDDNGFETQVAANGFEAGITLGTFRPAVVTLDLAMPGADGFHVIERIRSVEALRSTKILVVSGLPEEQLQRALDLGADACVNKPFEAHEIIDQVALLSGVDVSASSGLFQTA